MARNSRVGIFLILLILGGYAESGHAAQKYVLLKLIGAKVDKGAILKRFGFTHPDYFMNASWQEPASWVLSVMPDANIVKEFHTKSIVVSDGQRVSFAFCDSAEFALKADSNNGGSLGIDYVPKDANANPVHYVGHIQCVMPYPVAASVGLNNAVMIVASYLTFNFEEMLEAGANSQVVFNISRSGFYKPLQHFPVDCELVVKCTDVKEFKVTDDKLYRTHHYLIKCEVIKIIKGNPRFNILTFTAQDSDPLPSSHITNCKSPFPYSPSKMYRIGIMQPEILTKAPDFGQLIVDVNEIRIDSK